MIQLSSHIPGGANPRSRLRTALTLTLLLAALIASEVGAMDRCLTGESAFDDARALRDLATELEENCPCDEQRSKKGYRRCGKRLRRVAIEEERLREHCDQQARREVRDSTCGRKRVACGQVRRRPKGEGGDFQCEVTRKRKCRNGGGFRGSVCELNRCSEVDTWTAGTCNDPREFGPQTAGAREILWVKKSVVEPDEDRELPTAIWYPAAAEAGEAAPPFNAVLDAAIDRSGAPYPIVLFSHGSCGRKTAATYLFARLASRGFVVVAPPHPGNRVTDPGCGAVANLVNSSVERPQDMIFTLDQILAENAEPSSDFYQLLDPSRVAMMGHSFGGLTTLLTEEIEPRIRAAVTFNAALGGDGVQVPSLHILGVDDFVVSNDGIRNTYNNSVAPKILVEIERGGHTGVQDVCFECALPEWIREDQAKNVTLRWVVPFLERFLNGDEKAQAFFADPLPVGVQVTREWTPGP